MFYEPTSLKKLTSQNCSNNFTFNGVIFQENSEEQDIKIEEEKEKKEQVRNQKLDMKEKIMEIVKTLKDFGILMKRINL